MVNSSQPGVRIHFKETMATVTAGLAYTRNLGNFENAKVFFEITDDVRDEEDLDDAANRVYQKVEGLVEAKVKEIDADAAKR